MRGRPAPDRADNHGGRRSNSRRPTERARTGRHPNRPWGDRKGARGRPFSARGAHRDRSGVLVSLGGDISTAGDCPVKAGRSRSPTTTVPTSRWRVTRSRSATAGWRLRAWSRAAGSTRANRSTTSLIPVPVGRSTRTGGRRASRQATAPTRTSPQPRRSCSASGRPHGWPKQQLPARLITVDGTVTRAGRLAGVKTYWYLTRSSGAVSLILLTRRARDRDRTGRPGPQQALATVRGRRHPPHRLAAGDRVPGRSTSRPPCSTASRRSRCSTR